MYKSLNLINVVQEIAIPVYTLGLLVAIKLLIPNPHFPPVTVPQESPDMYNYLYGNITVAPSTKHVQVNYTIYFMDVNFCLNTCIV